jgi:hypothetical protein
VFENRVMRRIFGHQRDEITGDWRKLYNEELHSLYSSRRIVKTITSRRMRWAEHVRVGKPGGKRPLGRSRRRGEENILCLSFSHGLGLLACSNSELFLKL